MVDYADLSGDLSSSCHDGRSHPDQDDPERIANPIRNRRCVIIGGRERLPSAVN
jgi:hypothetical protein